MKRVIILFIIIALPVLGKCARVPFRDLSNSYRQQKNYFVSELGRKTISLYLKEKNPSKEVKEILDNIESIKVLSFTMNAANFVSGFIDNSYQSYGLTNFTPLKINRGPFENHLVFLKEGEKGFSDLIMINTTMTDVSLIEINGNIDPGKLVMLKDVFKIKGFDNLPDLEDGEKIHPENRHPSNNNDKVLYGGFPHSHSLPGSKTYSGNVSINEELSKISETAQDSLSDKSDNRDPKGVKIFSASGSELIGTNDSPSLLINGYKSDSDYQTALQNLNPDCIQSIAVTKEGKGIKKQGDQNSLIEVQLKGSTDELYIICEGILYFGQNGVMKSVSIDDECGPNLLVDCDEKPLSDILLLKPQQIKSIELTTDPRKCKGKLNGEFLVLESK